MSNQTRDFPLRIIEGGGRGLPLPPFVVALAS